ncbi:28S rRNA (cytosine-C(5))-methyltransferase-like [Pollicipes pollicipes]|uniref:28S rRNA (cytosine-C(5))-methyltransferase-like n=1 Tax=Pollicipes pollicipes TaxID=41117 RepID=UPI00188571B2|nr:28S rRNA (cytosine-C(5))-methyltransferase-like [Pollicipes pollicipes]
MDVPAETAEQSKYQHSVKLPYLYKEGAKILKAYSEKKGSLKTLVYATRQQRLYRRLLALVSRAVEHAPAVEGGAGGFCRRSGSCTRPSSDGTTRTNVLLNLFVYSVAMFTLAVRGVLRRRARGRGSLGYAEHGYLWGTAAAVLTVHALIAMFVWGGVQGAPRYARVNTLLASLDDVTRQLTAEGWERVEYPADVRYEEFIALVKALGPSQFLLDLHVPALLVFAAAGCLILQDKASCLPPLALAPSPGEQVLDACAAPGMKTSQLAGHDAEHRDAGAVERDQARFQTLSRMLRRAGVTNCRLICGDFLRLQPADHPQLTAILLDPSCSGTGMAGRESADSVSADRLQRLANLQGMLLRHALSFPAVRRVVYSTCSVTERENEQVVAATLAAHAEHDLCNGFFVATFVRAAENEARPGKHKVKTRKRATMRRGDGSGDSGDHNRKTCWREDRQDCGIG